MIEHIGAFEDRPLSRAVRAGDWLYVSGQASTDFASGQFIAGTFEEEYDRSIANLRAVLAEAGTDERQIVRVGAFVRDETDLPTFNRFYLATFAHPRPARTTTQMGFAFLRFEIEAVAYLGASSRAAP